MKKENMKKEKVTLAIQYDLDTIKVLRKLADKEDRSLSSFLRQVLKEYLERKVPSLKKMSPTNESTD